MGGATAVDTSITPEFECTPDSQFPACAGSCVGVCPALGGALGISYDCREVRLEQLGEMGEHAHIHVFICLVNFFVFFFVANLPFLYSQQVPRHIT